MAAFSASRIAILGVASEREYDEGVYLLSARALLAGHDLFVPVFSSQPPAFLETLALGMRLAGDSLETARLVVLGFALVALGAVADIGRRIAGTWAAPAAAAALALSATFGDLAHVVEAETPAVATGLLSLCACLESRRRGWHRGWLLASGALLALGALFKLIVIPLAAPLGLLLLLAPAAGEESVWKLDGPGRGMLGRIVTRSLVVAAGALVVGLVPLLFYDASALYEQNVAFHFAKHDVYRLTVIGNLRRAAMHVLGDGVLTATAVAGAALLLLRGRRLAALWLLAWAGLMLAAIATQAPLFWRHFVLLSPPLALLAGVAAALVAARLRPPVPAFLALATIGLWTAVVVTRTLGPSKAMFPLLPRPSRQPGPDYLHLASRWIHDNTAPGEYVAGDDPIAVYMAGRQAPPGLCDTSGARINSNSLTLQMAKQESATARVIVLRKNGRLSSLTGYVQWVHENYRSLPSKVTGVDERRAVWVRRSPQR
ncbi:MAG: glycosyltransferase family 39 protein [Candidatus Binatia bacterium]